MIKKHLRNYKKEKYLISLIPAFELRRFPAFSLTVKNLATKNTISLSSQPKGKHLLCHLQEWHTDETYRQPLALVGGCIVCHRGAERAARLRSFSRVIDCLYSKSVFLLMYQCGPHMCRCCLTTDHGSLCSREQQLLIKLTDSKTDRLDEWITFGWRL